MTFGRVIGRVWCTVKDRQLEGMRMLVVQPLTPDLRPTGKQIICADSVGAGAGELVYWARGREAMFPFRPAEPPVDNTIVGIVDSVHMGKAEPHAEPHAAEPRSPERPAAEPRRRGKKPC